MAYIRGLGRVGRVGDFYDGDYIPEEPYYIPVGGGGSPSIGQQPSVLDQFLNTGQRALELWLSYDARKDMQDLNLQRAAQGLPPINATDYMRMTAPQVQFGVASDTQKMLMYGAIGLGLVFVVTSLAKNRR